MRLRTGITLADPVRGDAPASSDTDRQVVAAERVGVDTVWSAEAWGTDGVVPLPHLAPLTSRIRLATGILQITARTPADDRWAGRRPRSSTPSPTCSTWWPRSTGKPSPADDGA